MFEEHGNEAVPLGRVLDEAFFAEGGLVEATKQFLLIVDQQFVLVRLHGGGQARSLGFGG